MIALSLNGTINLTEVRIYTPRRGVWQADCDAEIGSSDQLPSGPVTVQIMNAATGQVQTLTGTVIQDGTARFGERATVRVLGGAAGWRNTVPVQHFKNDAGVTIGDVLNATAAVVGETLSATDTPTTVLSSDYTRTAGPAVRVLDGLDWYVDATGITHVTVWPSTAAPADVEVMTWDPLRRIVEMASDSLITPMMTVTDVAKFGSASSTVTLRDVEQTFGPNGSRTVATCSTAVQGELLTMLQALVVELGGLVYLRKYRYRIVSQQTGPAGTSRLNLQAVKPTAGVPDLLPIDVWPGMAGFDAAYPTGTLCLVEFAEGDPSLPVIVAFQAPSASAAGFIAQASVTDSALSALRNAFNQHVHTSAASGSPTSIPTAVPNTIPVPDPGSTATQIGKAA